MATLSHPALKRRYHAADEAVDWLLEIAASNRKGHRVVWSAGFIEAVRREIQHQSSEAGHFSRQLDATEEEA